LGFIVVYNIGETGGIRGHEIGLTYFFNMELGMFSGPGALL
jgi:hypothetical protein